jgi:hypothetical protein
VRDNRAASIVREETTETHIGTGAPGPTPVTVRPRRCPGTWGGVAPHADKGVMRATRSALGARVTTSSSPSRQRRPWSTSRPCAWEVYFRFVRDPVD